MSASKGPSYPPIDGSLRLATGADLERVAQVSVMGFKETYFFTYARPDYKSLKYPQDTFDSVYDLYRAQLLDPRFVVVVIEDEYRPDEESDLPPTSSKPKGPVIVGILSLFLPEGSSRTGQFVVSDVGKPKGTLDRNLIQHRFEILAAATTANQDEHFDGKIILNKLVVHPSYWGRRHAAALLHWCRELSDADGVDLGVIPSYLSEQVYFRAGFEEAKGLVVIRDDGDQKGFAQKIFVYRSNTFNS